ncbi:MAG: hypothetical protein SVR94_17100 [Pseudomonadota bacterium]|nr:hypothetical protein [Pseudomonadota bacterium]
MIKSFKNSLFLTLMTVSFLSLSTLPAKAAKKDKSNPNVACPEDSYLVAKFNWSGQSYAFEKPAGNENYMTITGDAIAGQWQASEPISYIIVKGATGTYTEATEGTDGSFSQAGLPLNNGGQRPAISNIQFCQSETPAADGGGDAGSKSDAEGDYPDNGDAGGDYADGGAYPDSGDNIDSLPNVLQQPLAVVLSDLTINNGVVQWQTGREEDAAGYFVWKRSKVMIPAQGHAADYRYTDPQHAAGEESVYVLQALDVDGSSTFHVIGEDGKLYRFRVVLE